MTNSPSPPSITHEQLIALCDEMAALARAGVPLERGLVELAKDLPGRLGRVTGDVGRRLELGQSLDEVLGESKTSIPPAFRAVIVAGIRSDRLAEALEGVTKTLRRSDELRRITRASLIYPLFVVVLAYVLFVFTAARWAVTVAPAYGKLQAERNAPLDWIAWLGETAGSWSVWPPLALAMIVGLLWLRTRRVSWSGRGGRLSRWPTPGKLLHLGRLATFSDILSLLVRQHVPLTEAVALAGDACGDRRLAVGAHEFSRRIARGEPPEQAVAGAGAIPPLLTWRIAAGSHRGDLAESLQRAANGYRRAAQRTYEALSLTVPLTLTLGIGGTTALVYAVLILLPWFDTILNLTRNT